LINSREKIIELPWFNIGPADCCPPVTESKDLDMEVRVQSKSLDPWQAIQDYQQQSEKLAGKYGATSVFIGTMRDFNQGADVQVMTLEHYPGMTERHLEAVASESLDRWDIQDVLVVHRVGELRPNDPIVLVAIWSAHRDSAFSACRYVIDELKTRAPFWKQESTTAGKRWVEQEHD
jgi:molybdopterin synthase catalytic subunit